MSFCGIEYISQNVKIGAIYPNESLNTEFKKFTLDKKDDIVTNNIKDWNTFFETGNLTPSISNLIMNIIKSHIESRIPKYTSCFFNIKNNNLAHSESFFFIGIDDDGVIGGIPFNFSNISEYHLCNMIKKTIESSIKLNVKTNNIPHNIIMECIETKILKFRQNNTNTNFLSSISKQNLKQIDIWDKQIDEFEKIVYNDETTKKDLLLVQEALIQEDIKNNKRMRKFIFERIINSKYFRLKKFVEDKYYLEKLKEITFNFNPESDYIKKYNENLNTILYRIKYNMSEIDITSPWIINNIGTYMYEEIKTLLNRLKDKITDYYKDARETSRQSNFNLDKLKEKRNNMFYTFETHYNTISTKNEYILIKIKFNAKLYQTKLEELGYKNHSYPELSYIIKNKTGVMEEKSATRVMKYKNNKLDPECSINK